MSRYNNADYDDMAYELDEFLKEHRPSELLKLVQEAVEWWEEKNNALPPAEEEKKVIREHARLVLEGVAKMCNERRNLLEFKCEGCSFLDWCVDISDSVTYEPWEWLAIEGVMEID